MGVELDPNTMKSMTREDFRSVILQKGRGAISYCVSKYQCAEIGIAFMKMKSKSRDECVQRMYDWAASSLPVSAVFIKVY